MEPTEKQRQALIEQKVRDRLADDNRRMSKPMRWTVYSVAGAFGLFIVAAFGIAIFTPERPAPIDWHSAVERACHSAVERQLKDPSSASYRDEQIGGTPEDGWTMRGIVNATNSFGGSVPTPFTCAATAIGDGSVSAFASLD